MKNEDQCKVKDVLKWLARKLAKLCFSKSAKIIFSPQSSCLFAFKSAPKLCSRVFRTRGRIQSWEFWRTSGNVSKIIRWYFLRFSTKRLLIICHGSIIFGNRVVDMTLISRELNHVSLRTSLLNSRTND